MKTDDDDGVCVCCTLGHANLEKSDKYKRDL